MGKWCMWMRPHWSETSIFQGHHWLEPWVWAMDRRCLTGSSDMWHLLFFQASLASFLLAWCSSRLLLDCSPFASMKQKNMIPQPVDFPLGKYKKKQLTHSYQSPFITIITINPHKIPQIPILLRLSQQRALGGDGFHPNPAANPRVWAAARVQHPLGLCPDAAARAIDVASSWVGTLSPGFSLFSMCFVVDYGIMKWSQRDELVVWRTVVCKNCDHTCFPFRFWNRSEQTWVRMVMKLLNSTATGFVEDPSSKGSFQLFCYVCTS